MKTPNTSVWDYQSIIIAAALIVGLIVPFSLNNDRRTRHLKPWLPENYTIISTPSQHDIEERLSFPLYKKLFAGASDQKVSVELEPGCIHITYEVKSDGHVFYTDDFFGTGGWLSPLEGFDKAQFDDGVISAVVAPRWALFVTLWIISTVISIVIWKIFRVLLKIEEI